MIDKVHKSIFSDTFEDLYLKRGTVIMVSHDKINHPQVNIIQKVENECIYFRIPPIFQQVHVEKGDTLKVSILTDGYEYVLKGTILELNYQYPSLLQLDIFKIDRYANRRIAKRYYVDMEAQITFPNKSTSKGTVRNISENGLSLICDVYMEPGSFLYVEFLLPEQEQQGVLFKVRIVRIESLSNNDYQYGLEIVESDYKSKIYLNIQCQKLQEDETLYIANYLK